CRRDGAPHLLQQAIFRLGSWKLSRGNQRRVQGDADVSTVEPSAAGRVDPAAAVDGHGYHRNTRLERQHETAALEGEHPEIPGTGSLGEHDHALAGADDG